MSRPAQKKSNVALLTEGQAYIQRAKKARRDQVEEIKFDDEARRDWLTGFSKRKKAKTDDKRARAKERDHQAHLDERRKARQDLRERAAENVKSMRKAMGLDDDDDDENAEGEEVKAGPSKPREVDEAEYSDEDQLATVTITEDFDPSTFTSRQPARATGDSDAEGEDGPSTKPQEEVKVAKKIISSLPPSSGKLAKLREKKKEQKREVARSRSMETNAERRKGREIEARRRTQKASLAMERDGRQRGVSKGRGIKSPSGRGRGRGKGRK